MNAPLQPLARYDAARRALADANSVDEVKEIRSQSEAMRAYARISRDKEMEADAAEIRMRAGLGYWTRANTEVCLLATRGAPQRIAMDVPQVIMAPAGRHSEKPEEARRRIERLTAGPYLELYGRQTVPEWHVWGNEIPAKDFGS
jgi:N6-adenosine-specific RNA methylase IME4